MRVSVALLAALPMVVACSKPTNQGAAEANATSTSTSTPTANAAPTSSTTSTATPNGAPTPPKDLNVILLSIDSLRADMPWAGYPRPIAPRLTELEKRAVSYTRAYSMSSYTSMSLGGLLAGRLPSELQRSGYFFGTYRNETFFPKLLQARGVRTMAVHAHGYFKKAGFENGFDVWEVVPDIRFDNTTDRNVTSPASEEIAERLLGNPENTSGRFFFWAHFLDPHDLYLPHEGIGPYGKSDRDKYDAEVQFTDGYIGKLLDFIEKQPWASRTAIIVTSDHGEAFGEHQMTRHGFELWENLVHVPLFIVAPGIVPRRIDQPRSAIDLAPTILELLDAPLPEEKPLEGKSLVPEIWGADAEPRDVYIDLPMTSDNDRRRALVRGSQKLICFHDDVQCKLYDLEKDPGELSPIVRGDAFKAMRDAYQERAKQVKEVAPYACRQGCLNREYANK